jgi:hypothetical protein
MGNLKINGYDFMEYFCELPGLECLPGAGEMGRITCGYALHTLLVVWSIVLDNVKQLLALPHSSAGGLDWMLPLLSP